MFVCLFVLGGWGGGVVVVVFMFVSPNEGSFSYTPAASFIEEFSYAAYASFSEKFVLHDLILCSVRSFSYTTHARFSEEFLLHFCR